jgi:hypothetical protein
MFAQRFPKENLCELTPQLPEAASSQLNYAVDALPCCYNQTEIHSE